MSQLKAANLLHFKQLCWSFVQAMLLYSARAKTVATQKRREVVEKRMVIEVIA
jgi:hypothetical protein